MEGGFVALLDVLGFSALVASDPSGQNIRRYLDSLQVATRQSKVDYVVFSDSIVLTAGGEGPESLIAVASACSRLLGNLLNHGIALRGAIAFGHFFRSAIAKSVFVAGRAVIDAYQFEQAQDWVGVMVTPSAMQQVPDLEARGVLNENPPLDVAAARLPGPPSSSRVTEYHSEHQLRSSLKALTDSQ